MSKTIVRCHVSNLKMSDIKYENVKKWKSKKTHIKMSNVFRSDTWRLSLVVWSEEKTPWHIIVMRKTKTNSNTNSNTRLLISMGGRIRRRIAARCSVRSAWLLTISIVLSSRRTWNVFAALCLSCLTRFLNFALSTLSLPIRHLTNVVYW